MADPNQQPLTSGMAAPLAIRALPIAGNVASSIPATPAVSPGGMIPAQAAANAAMIAGMQRPQMGVGVSLPYTAAQAVRPANASPMPFTPAADARYMAAQNAADAQIRNSMFGSDHWNPGNTGFMGVPLDGSLPGATPQPKPATAGSPLDTTTMERAVVPGAPPDLASRGQPPIYGGAPAVDPITRAPGYGTDWGPGTAFPLQGPNDRGPAASDNQWGWYATHDTTFFDPFGRGGGGPGPGAIPGGGGFLPAAFPSAPQPAGAPVAANAPGGATPSIYDAFMQQESSGGKTAPDNPFQIQPDTFKRFAKDGESYDNVNDKNTVAKRFIDYLGQRYNGDPARMAVGYFSGEGNVAPLGSATPYLQDRQDKSGKSVSSYVNDMLGRVGASGFRDPYPTNQAAYADQYAHQRELFNRGMQWVQQAPDAFQMASRGRIFSEMMNAANGSSDLGRAQAAGTDAYNLARGNYWAESARTAAELAIAAGTPHEIGEVPGVLPGSTIRVMGTPNIPGVPQAAPPAPINVGAGATGTVKPSLEQFLTVARAKNPGVSEQDLTSYYKKTYGQ